MKWWPIALRFSGRDFMRVDGGWMHYVQLKDRRQPEPPWRLLTAFVLGIGGWVMAGWASWRSPRRAAVLQRMFVGMNLVSL